MRNRSNFDEKEVMKLFETTDMTVDQIARNMRCRTTTVTDFLSRTYTPEFMRLRKTKMYRLSKLGDKNPMFSKFREDHPRYKGLVSDGNGYLMVLKPEWYSGRRGCKHVFEHSVVMCEHLGLTEIPAGMQIHHIDGDKKNNDINNLVLLTSTAHQRLHSLQAQRLAEMRREQKALEMQSILRGKYREDGDIVYSTQECVV